MSEVSIVGPNGEANEIKEEVHSSDERDRHISPPASSRQEAARLEIEQAVIHSKNAVNTDDPNETPDLIFNESGPDTQMAPLCNWGCATLCGH